ncbi:ABC transporter ATP-binding protein [Vagococcus sp.]|uniref:ABC transporter ATP-binding protein n=1 Tax=Vagococcus sp. TaxID=1933889 RepID=UPI003F95FB2B
MSKKKILIHYLKPFKKSIITASLLGIINGFFLALTTFYIGKAIDQMPSKQQVNFPKLFLLLTLLACIIFVSSLTQWLIQRIGNQVAFNLIQKIRKEGVDHLNQLPIRFFDTHLHGDIMSRFTNDLELVATAFTAIFNQVFSGLTMLLVSFICMLVLNLPLTLIVVGSTILMSLVNFYIAKKSQKSFKQQQKQLGKMNGFLSEYLPEQKLIHLLEHQKVTIQQFEMMNQQLQIIGQKSQFYSSLTNPLSRFIDHLGYLTIGLVGGLLLISTKSTMSIGIISSFILYASQFSKPIIELSGTITQLLSGKAGFERVVQLFDEVKEKEDTYPLTKTEPLKGELEFKKVSFDYEYGQPLFKNLSFKIEPGETVAIVGQTGSGKSTIINLIMRFYDVTSGAIFLDHRPLTSYSKNNLRKKFGLVLQDPWLFKASLLENLTYGYPEASLETVKEACQKVAMEGFIERLPNGFDTVIDEKQLTLSEGQKQLLTIARLIISQPEFLILDEATSSIDSFTDSMIQQALAELMENRTSIVIAHRLATITSADKIIVLHNGAIVETGTHHDMIKQSDSYYYKIFKSQFK